MRGRPGDEPPVSFRALVAAATRVTGAEAMVIVLRGDEGPLHVDCHTGLSESELEAFSASLGADDAGFLEREFEGVLRSEIIVEGGSVGFIAALQRAKASFENQDLIDTFAIQVGLCVALASRPPVYDEVLETWAMLDRLVLSAHSLGELGRALTAVIGPLFGNARIGVMIADRQRRVLQMMPGAFDADEFTVASHRVGFFDPRSNSARVLTTGLPYISNASAGDASIRQEYVGVFGLSRVLTVPLGDVGVLHIVDGAADFDLEDLSRAEGLAPRIASIVELAAALYGARREQRIEETICRAAVAVASGDSIHTVMEQALRELCESTEAALLAFVLDDAPPILVSTGRRAPEIERAVIDEAGTDPGMRAYVVGPQRAGDPGWAAFYVPVTLSGVRLGTLAALRLHGEPFTRFERGSFMRMANVAALNYAAERYQQQRAELARLQERQRLADDLHDDVAQILFAAQLSLDSILEQDEVDDGVARRISRARGMLIRGDTAIRTVIHKLSSPPAADIATRLASVVSGVEDEFSLPIHVHIEPEVAGAARGLGRSASDALIKGAREALVNAAKHAGPCRVNARLELVQGRLLLTVADDGLGATVPRSGHHHGLASVDRLIRDQGGWTEVKRGEAGGTVVTVGVPCEDAGDHATGTDHDRSGDEDALGAQTVAV
jgi:signal transduction histidine kinase